MNKLYKGFEDIQVREEGKCLLCKEPVSPDDFKDALDLAEFEISGMCIKCQRKIFDES